MSPQTVALTRPVVAVFTMGMGDEVSASWLTMRRQRFPIVRSEGFNAKRAAKTGKPERAKTACEGLLLQPARHHFLAQHNRRHHNGKPQAIAQPATQRGLSQRKHNPQAV